ncbi:MAG: helix-hairpin-helix domain-containing protein [Anaerolineae bacterium]
MKVDKNVVIGGFLGLVIGATLAIAGLTLANRVRPAPIVIVPPEPTPTAVPIATPGPIQVFVNGHVARPAVYALPPNGRVQEAIDAAGGFADDADTAVVNLALPLTDGAQVYVPGLADEAPPPLTVSLPTAVPAVVESGAPSGGSSGGLVNINTATPEQLDALPGIGPSTAQKILDYLDENGRFQTIEEIMNVSGIGEAKFNQIKDLITVDN